MPSTNKEVFKQDFGILRESIVVKDLSTIGDKFDCDYEIKVFANPDDPTNDDQNDFTAPLIPLSNSQINPVLYLEKENTCCEFEQVAELIDNTYGELFNDSSRPDWIGYKLLWLNVYDIHGKGTYRIRLEYSDLLTAKDSIEYSYKYKLNKYNDNLANETVRFTYTVQGGKIGDVDNDEVVVDYGSISWTRQLRLRGIFGYKDTQEYEEESIRFSTGANVWTTNNSQEVYSCILKELPHSIHNEFKKVVLLSGSIVVDDYNLINITTYKNKRVIKEGNYEPFYDRYSRFGSSVELKFKQYYQNNRAERC